MLFMHRFLQIPKLISVIFPFCSAGKRIECRPFVGDDVVVSWPRPTYYATIRSHWTVVGADKQPTAARLPPRLAGRRVSLRTWRTCAHFGISRATCARSLHIAPHVVHTVAAVALLIELQRAKSFVWSLKYQDALRCGLCNDIFCRVH